MKPRIPDPAIKQWATPTQAKSIDAVIEHGGLKPAARALGINAEAVRQHIIRAEKKARVSGFDPAAGMTKPVGDPFFVKGVSSYYGPKGELRGQWVKTAIDQERRLQIIEEYIDSKLADLPAVEPIEPPKITAERLCNLYTMTDCHVGMLAWGKENGGQPWDLKIAEATLKGCFKAMLDQAPAARVGIINQLGDWMHVDKIDPLTPASGHILDADIRFPKIVQVSLDVLEWFCIETLKKHDEVWFIFAEGNHDPVSSVWMRLLFTRLFRDNPRVMVCDSNTPYHTYQHGKTMLAFHHGHKLKPSEAPLMFAARYPEIWGATKYRYGHSGHMHHQMEALRERGGMIWRQHPTLAAPDSYSVRGGWDSKREATAITYHSEYGQVGTVTVSPEMLGL